MKAAGVAAVVVLGGSALGVGLSHASSPSSSTSSAATENAPSAPPPAQYGGDSSSSGSGAASSGPSLGEPQAPAGLHFVHGVTTLGAHSPTFASAVGGANGRAQSGICTRAGCGGVATNGIVEVAKRKIGILQVTAYLVTVSKLSRTGVQQPLGVGASGTGTSSASGTAPSGSSGSSGTSSGGLPQLPASIPSCDRSQELIVEVSSQKGFEAEAIVPVATGVHGVFENLAEALVTSVAPNPVAIAVAEVSDPVATVSARFATGATDRTVPSHGWVLLVGRPSTPEAAGDGVSLVARSSAGSVLGRQQIPAPGYAAVATGSC